MNVARQRETTTATVDVNDYHLLHLLAPVYSKKLSAAEDWMIDAEGHLCFSVQMMNAFLSLFRTAGCLAVYSVFLNATQKSVLKNTLAIQL